MLDNWNRDAIYSRAYFTTTDKDDRVTYEGTLSFAAGLTHGQVKSFFDLFDEEFDKFVRRLGGFKEKDDGPTDGTADKVGPPEILRQGFPADRADPAQSDSAWEIEWDIFPLTAKSKILRIVKATFRWKDAKKAWRSLVVVRNLVLAEAFTQYDDMKTCFLDVAKVGTTPLKAHKDFLGPACVGKGEILTSNNAAFDNKVYKELHYDGLRWMGHEGGLQARKGEKLVLWSAIRAGNYIYLVEYNFTDDGRIVCRLGFTAHNYFNQKQDQGDVHLHIGCWRLDFDLSDPNDKIGGPNKNQIQLVSRKLVNGEFKIVVTPFPGVGKGNPAQEAREGKAKWVATEFTTLRVESLQLKNGRGEPIAYDLISTRTGSAADLKPFGNAKGMNMDFVNWDFWVTLSPKEFRDYYQVVDLAAKAQPLRGQPTTIWHSVPGLHVPRNEDFGPGGDSKKGAALTEWVSFTLRPRNLFDITPFYVPGIKRGVKDRP